MIHKKGSFLRKAGQWITDPKQILTAAGYYLGGPKGAGIGRSIGGMIPDPWGNRESTLEDGLDWEDVGQAGQDFVSGYSAGKMGQQIPGIRDLEGAFGQEGAFRGGPGGPSPGGPSLGIGEAQGAVSAPPVGRNIEKTLSFPDRGTAVGQAPDYGRPGHTLPTVVAEATRRPGTMGAEQYFGGPTDIAFGGPAGPPSPPRFEEFQGDWAQQGRRRVPQDQAGGVGLPGFDPNRLDQNVAQERIAGIAGEGLFGGDTRNIPFRGGGGGEPDDEGLLNKAERFFGELTGFEKIYAMNALANALSSGFASDEPKEIGQKGTDMLGQMGMFSPTQRRQVPSFDEWRSRR